ncbi:MULTISPECIES: DUF262 domain-containing protein [unclassified Frankia]|uniref:GmrSD restriction endonuclease domain-containing protein n=1 Tax=unclassified Frankia TaxID=2632575 RepID=UPI001EF6EE95|nr:MULTISPECIES: DUF262 domain-containing protein [unclassified Frankia]
MAVMRYKDTAYPVNELVQHVKRGTLALPDIQRPFVWQHTKVRNLLDSMYRGFPVGNLLFWETGTEAGARQIGESGRTSAPRLLIVDGQQRLTSLFAVMTGQQVLKDDFTTTRIRIAFRPSDETFAVTDAAIEKDPEYLADVSVLWSPEVSNRQVVREFLGKLERKRELDDAERDRLDEAIGRLINLTNYNFQVVELSADLDGDEVAEIFVRINSEGVTLNQADFILTLMSVFWDKGRRDLEEFCRSCLLPSRTGASPFNWFIEPKPDQLLRVVIAVALRRATLKQVYTVLRGREAETGKESPVRRDSQFAQLQAAQEHVLDLTNWHEFLDCIERAGFRSTKMISSQNALIFSYALWLIGRIDFGVPIDRLREVIARWFFMAHTTGRYSGSVETQVERDLSRLRDLSVGDSNAFAGTLSKIIDDTFTQDYFTITLPNELATSGAKSPVLLAYFAALNILDADVLLSTGKIRSRMDPAVLRKKGIERHHLFPQNYLKKVLGVTDASRINQAANMAMVDWNDNIAILDKAPDDYWSGQLAAKGIAPDILDRQVEWHALPTAWTKLSYDEFLAQRRVLMAKVIGNAFDLLSTTSYRADYPPSPLPGDAERRTSAFHGIKIADLLAAGLLAAGTTLTPSRGDDVVATVDADGNIVVDDERYDSPSGAAKAATGLGLNGWVYWVADTAQGEFTLAELRAAYAGDDPSSAS